MYLICILYLEAKLQHRFIELSESSWDFESLSSLSRSRPPLLAPQGSWRAQNPSSSLGTCLKLAQGTLSVVWWPCRAIYSSFSEVHSRTNSVVCSRSPLLCPPVVCPPAAGWRSWRTVPVLATGGARTAWQAGQHDACERGPGEAGQEEGTLWILRRLPTQLWGLRVHANCYAQWQIPEGDF